MIPMNQKNPFRLIAHALDKIDEVLLIGMSGISTDGVNSGAYIIALALQVNILIVPKILAVYFAIAHIYLVSAMRKKLLISEVRF